MSSFLFRWFINVISLFAVVNIVPGISTDNWPSLLLAALVLGLLNAFLRPFLLLLTLPVNIATLGLFTLVLNAFLFYFAAFLVKGFIIAGFWYAFLGALVFSIISFMLSTLIKSDRK